MLSWPAAPGSRVDAEVGLVREMGAGRTVRFWRIGEVA